MRSKRFLAVAAAAVAVALGMTACSSDSSETADGGNAGSGSSSFPVTIEHAFGTTTIDAKPERVATVAWANHEVPLALGVVPVGMAAATFGDDNGNGNAAVGSRKSSTTLALSRRCSSTRPTASTSKPSPIRTLTSFLPHTPD